MDNYLRNTIIDSLEYELDFLEEKYKLYNPNKKSKTFLNSFLDYLKGFLFLLFSPLFPFFNIANRFKVKKNTHSNILNFITSPNIVSSGDENVLGFIKIGNQYSFNIKHYIEYLKLIYGIVLKFGFKTWCYQCVIKLPEMIMVIDFISTASIKTVKISNHYDRWAYIFSFVCIKKDIKLIVYQHGVVLNSRNEGWKPKKKLPRVNELFCYDKKSENFFKENIYVHVNSVSFFKNKIDFNYVDSVGVNFLIIGSGFLEYVKQEVIISNHIVKASSKVSVFIKPHPKFKFPYSRLGVARGAKIINFNIKPDVVIHFGSTLAKDIELELQNVIDLDVSLLGLDESLTRINTIMKNVT